MKKIILPITLALISSEVFADAYGASGNYIPSGQTTPRYETKMVVHKYQYAGQYINDLKLVNFIDYYLSLYPSGLTDLYFKGFSPQQAKESTVYDIQETSIINDSNKLMTFNEFKTWALHNVSPNSKGLEKLQQLDEATFIQKVVQAQQILNKTNNDVISINTPKVK